MSVLNGAQFYHGSLHDIPVGEVVRHGVQPSKAAASPGMAYATHDPSIAGLYGRIHVVEPVDRKDVEPDPLEKDAVRTRAGFRVVGHVDGTSDFKQHYSRYRGWDD